MEFATHDELTLTELDHARLARLRDADGPSKASPIDAALDAAQLVPSDKVGPDVVTMGSQVLLEEPATRQTWAITVTYPPDADASAGFISVLSPVGASLIGRRIGDIARWRTPYGGLRSAQVVDVLFQPEASGLYTL